MTFIIYGLLYVAYISLSYRQILWLLARIILAMRRRETLVIFLCQLHFQFSGPIYMLIFAKYFYHSIIEFVFFNCNFIICIVSTTRNIENLAHSENWIFISVCSDNFYFRPIIRAACFRISFSINNCLFCFLKASTFFLQGFGCRLL